MTEEWETEKLETLKKLMFHIFFFKFLYLKFSIIYAVCEGW